MEHPIGNMMQTTMENIKDMVDVNTVIGDAVQAGSGATIIPVSKVCFGFLAGGGEYEKDEKGKLRTPTASETKWPFAGGSGAGVSVQPVGFLVVSDQGVRMLSAQPGSMADRMVELIPQVVDDVKSMFADKNDKKKSNVSFTTSKPPTDDTDMDVYQLSGLKTGEPTIADE